MDRVTLRKISCPRSKMARIPEVEKKPTRLGPCCRAVERAASAIFRRHRTQRPLRWAGFLPRDLGRRMPAAACSDVTRRGQITCSGTCRGRKAPGFFAEPSRMSAACASPRRGTPPRKHDSSHWCSPTGVASAQRSAPLPEPCCGWRALRPATPARFDGPGTADRAPFPATIVRGLARPQRQRQGKFLMTATSWSASAISMRGRNPLFRAGIRPHPGARARQSSRPAHEQPGPKGRQLTLGRGHPPPAVPRCATTFKGLTADLLFQGSMPCYRRDVTGPVASAGARFARYDRGSASTLLMRAVCQR